MGSGFRCRPPSLVLLGLTARCRGRSANQDRWSRSLNRKDTVGDRRQRVLTGEKQPDVLGIAVFELAGAQDQPARGPPGGGPETPPGRGPPPGPGRGPKCAPLPFFLVCPGGSRTESRPR